MMMAPSATSNSINPPPVLENLLLVTGMQRMQKKHSSIDKHHNQNSYNMRIWNRLHQVWKGEWCQVRPGITN